MNEDIRDALADKVMDMVLTTFTITMNTEKMEMLETILANYIELVDDTDEFKTESYEFAVQLLDGIQKQLAGPK